VHASARYFAENNSPVEGMQKLYANENLTQARKRLLWFTKQAAKHLKYTYVWTTNGKIYICKNEDLQK